MTGERRHTAAVGEREPLSEPSEQRKEDLERGGGALCRGVSVNTLRWLQSCLNARRRAGHLCLGGRILHRGEM